MGRQTKHWLMAVWKLAKNPARFGIEQVMSRLRAQRSTTRIILTHRPVSQSIGIALTESYTADSHIYAAQSVETYEGKFVYIFLESDAAYCSTQKAVMNWHSICLLNCFLTSLLPT